MHEKGKFREKEDKKDHRLGFQPGEEDVLKAILMAWIYTTPVLGFLGTPRVPQGYYFVK